MNESEAHDLCSHAQLGNAKDYCLRGGQVLLCSHPDLLRSHPNQTNFCLATLIYNSGHRSDDAHIDKTKVNECPQKDSYIPTGD